MKRAPFISWIILIVTFVMVIPPAFAADQTPDQWSKLGRGLNNVAFCWIEIPHTAAERAEKGERWPIAIVAGLTQGVFNAVSRAVVGVYEVGTFPIANPSGDFGPLLEPEFIVPTS